jgi:SWI/SNF-related matrix-associated actin-dependent regulator of chromatin subfamily A3
MSPTDRITARIEDALEEANIRYDRLDGTMKREERTRAMDALKYDPKTEVLLVSLRAGGVGLNLTAARRVYLMDPYWLVTLPLFVFPPP